MFNIERCTAVACEQAKWSYTTWSDVCIAYILREANYFPSIPYLVLVLRVHVRNKTEGFL